MRWPALRVPTKKTKPRRSQHRTAGDGLRSPRNRRVSRRHTKDVENEADETVVRRQRQQHLVHENDMLKVVDHALSVEEIHGGGKPVPVQALDGPEVAGAARDVGDGNDLLERYYLDRRNDHQDVDMAHEQGGEETTNHDEGPESTGNEVGLFLLVLGQLLLLGRLGLLLIDRHCQPTKPACLPLADAPLEHCQRPRWATPPR